MVEDFGYTRIFPNCCYGSRASCVEMSIRVWVNGELHDELAVLNVFGDLWSNVELLHSSDECFGAINDILVDGMPVKAQFVDAITVLVDNLHLLDNSRLAALTRTFARGVLADDLGRIGFNANVPSSKILHSRRSFLESSSRPRSMA
jgi:hypothetical protein